MKLIPVNGRLALARLDGDRVSSGGIIIPDSAQKQSQRAIVLAVYDAYTDDEGVQHVPKFAAEEEVLIPKYSGEEFELQGGKKIVMIKESEILAVIRDYGVVSLPSDERETA